MGERIRDEKRFLIHDPPLKFDVFGNGGIETGGERVGATKREHIIRT